MSTPTTVRVADDGAVRVITLDRPAVKNAIDFVLRAELTDVIEAAMADDAVRSVVLTGAGGAFCSGGDISTMKRQAAGPTRERVSAAARVTRAIWDGDKPVVAAVEGPAIGAGLALALACDRVVAGRGAVFGASFTAIGLAGDMGIFASLPARVGPSIAKQLMLLPRRLPAEEALRLGLVDALTETGEALDAAMTDARTLAAGPPLALTAIKRTFASWPRPQHDVLDLEVELAARLFDTDDFEEAIAAFRQRRSPVFRGR